MTTLPPPGAPCICRYYPYCFAHWGLNTQHWVKNLAWLDSALAASTAEWKLIVGHHGTVSSGARQLLLQHAVGQGCRCRARRVHHVASSRMHKRPAGKHGGSALLRATLEPLIWKYKAQALFAGALRMLGAVQRDCASQRCAGAVAGGIGRQRKAPQGLLWQGGMEGPPMHFMACACMYECTPAAASQQAP